MSQKKPPRFTQKNRTSDPEFTVRRAYMFPKTLADALSPAALASFAAHGFDRPEVIIRWRYIIGASLAPHCHPVALHHSTPTKAGKLEVRCPSAWGLHVQYQEKQILERLAYFYGYRPAEKIQLLHYS